MENNKEQQSAQDRATIRVRLIENGLEVSAGAGWFYYPDWPKASEYIAARIKVLEASRLKRIWP